MDARHFDSLVRSLGTLGTRRGILALLSSVPLFGGLLALLDRDETDAKGRRKRRKKRHKHGKGRHKGKRQKKCKPKSLAKTCAGKCGPVKNTCKKTVDCGSCACDPPCEACFTCQEGPNTPGACVVDPAQQGEECGDPGQFCQADGSCACQTGSCANPTPICAGGECVGCADTRPCSNGCCDASGACQDGITNSACGFPGQQCTNCAATGEDCTDRACVCGSGVFCATDECCPTASDVCDADDRCCTPTTCAAQGKNCGTIDDGCGDTIDCGNCTPGSTTPLCVNNVCTACSPGNACPSGCCASDGRCQAGTGDGACGAIGGSCIDCGPGRRCVNRQCVCDSTSCPNGCCDGTTCRIDDNAACGTGGGSCTTCSGTGVTCGGGGIPGECGCTPACGPLACGPNAPDGCGTLDCGDCESTEFCSGNICLPCGLPLPGTPCCAGNTCQSTFDICQGGSCVACGQALQPCCASDSCFGPNTFCQGDICVPCGLPAQLCCPGNICQPGIAFCSGSLCFPCGIPGQPCCQPGNLCQPPGACVSGTCGL